MGFWTNNPSSAPKARKQKGEPKTAKTGAASHGSTWTQGRQTAAHVVSVLLIAAIVCGPVGLWMSWQAISRPAAATQVVSSEVLTVEHQDAGAYAVGFVADWLGAWKDHPGQLGDYVDVNTLRTLSEVPAEYRDLTVAQISPNDSSNIVTVVVAASVKELGPDPTNEGGAMEIWPRRYFQVPVIVTDAGMRPVGLPVPVAAPTSTGAVQLAYAKPLPSADPAAVTVMAFLKAYATGQGDLSVYVSPGSEIAPITPAPYLAVESVDLRADTDVTKTPRDGAQLRVLATVTLTSQLDQTVTSTYALTLTARATRWEVSSIDPAPAEIAKSDSASAPAPIPSPSR
jgi:hypothetical protein